MNNVIPLQNSPERVSLLPSAPDIYSATAVALRHIATSTGARQAYLEAPRPTSAITCCSPPCWTPAFVSEKPERWARSSFDRNMMYTFTLFALSALKISFHCHGCNNPLLTIISRFLWLFCNNPFPFLLRSEKGKTGTASALSAVISDTASWTTHSLSL